MPKLLEQVRTVIRLRHYSLRTEQTCVSWIKQYILFSNKRPPAELGSAEVTKFLSYLGHKDLNTTMIYTHVLNRGGRGVKSPLDEG